MGSCSAIYTVCQNVAVAADGAIPFGSVIRRFGQAVTLDGQSVVVCGPGYYDVDVVVTLLPEAAGNVGVQLLADGSPVPGATSQGVGVAGSPLTLPVRAMVRQKCCGATSIGLRLVTPEGTTTGATVENCACVVEKV